MRLRLFLHAALVALAGCAVAPPPAPPAEAVHVRFIGINDFHGNLEPTGLNLVLADPAAPHGSPMRVNVGGAAALAGMVQKLRAGASESLFLAGGDLIGGAPLPSALFRHESTVEILGDIGLEVSSLGNHEFDAGEKELQRMIKGGCATPDPKDVATSCASVPYAGARFTYIAANVLDERGRPIVAPYVVRNFKGIPVGIIGGVTKSTTQLVSPSGILGLTFADEADATNRAARELREKGVKAMIAVYHEGLTLGAFPNYGDWNDVTCPQAHGPLLGIARRLDPAIKVIFSGHTHQGYRCEVEGRLLIQGTSFGRGISVVDVALDRATGAMLPPVRSYNLAVVNDFTEPAQREKLAAAAPPAFGAVLREARPDAKIADKVAHYAALASPKGNRPIGVVGGSLMRSDVADSSAGRVIADAQLAATRSEGAQIAFMNPGGIRSSIECKSPPCTVTFGQVFTMQPFGNSLVVMNLTGARLKDLLESQRRPSGNPYFLQPSEGFSYTWQSNGRPGEQVRDMRLHGEAIVPDKSYRITVNSFLAEGGDGFAILPEGTERKGGGQDVDAMIDYLASERRTPPTTPRITVMK